MSLTFYDFIIYFQKSLASDPHNMVYLEFVILILVLLIIGLVSIIAFGIKGLATSIGMSLGKMNYLDKRNDKIKERTNEKVLKDNLKSSMKKIDSQDINEVAIGLEYLKYQPPSLISIYKMVDLLSRDDLPDKIKNNTIDNLVYLLNLLRR